MGTAEAVVPRYDYAIFTDDEYVTNALLTPGEVEGMEAEGFRCVRVRDTVAENLPAFRAKRGVSYVQRQRPNSRSWDR